MREYHVYIMASLNRRLYIGVTNDLQRRNSERKQLAIPGFTRMYRVTKLVYFEVASDIHAAIAREKQLKRWPRWRKERLIEAHNAGWLDLGAQWHLDTIGDMPSATVRAPTSFPTPGE